jgi:hypothetical protein
MLIPQAPLRKVYVASSSILDRKKILPFCAMLEWEAYSSVANVGNRLVEQRFNPPRNPPGILAIFARCG